MKRAKRPQRGLDTFKTSELIRIFAATISSLGYSAISEELEEVSGVSASSPSYEKLKSVVRSGQWQTALAMLDEFDFSDDDRKTAERILYTHWFHAVNSDTPEMAVLILRTMRPSQPDLAAELSFKLGNPEELDSPLDELDELLSPTVRVSPKRLEQLIQQAGEWDVLTGAPSSEVSVKTAVVHGLEKLGYSETSQRLQGELGISLKDDLVKGMEQALADQQWDKALQKGVEVFADPKTGLCRIIAYALQFISPVEGALLARKYSANLEPADVGMVLVSKSSTQDLAALLQSLKSLIRPEMLVPDDLLENILSKSLKYQCSVDTYWCTQNFDRCSLLSDISGNKSRFPMHWRQTLGHNGEVWTLEYSRNGRYLASGTNTGTFYIWERRDKQFHLVIEVERHHHGGIRTIDWSHDDQKILTGGTDGCIKIFDVNLMQPVLQRKCSRALGVPEVDVGVTAVCWLPDDSGFFTGGHDRQLIRWSVYGVNQWSHKNIRILSMSLVKDKLAVLSARMKFSNRVEHQLLLFDVKEPKYVDIIPIHSQLTSFSVSSDSRFFLMNTVPNGLRIWDYENEDSNTQFLKGPKQKYLTIGSKFMGPFDKYVVAGSEDHKIRIFNRYTNKLVCLLDKHSDVVNDVAISPNSSIIASAGDDGNIFIWGREHR